MPLLKAIFQKVTKQITRTNMFSSEKKKKIENALLERLEGSCKGVNIRISNIKPMYSCLAFTNKTYYYSNTLYTYDFKENWTRRLTVFYRKQ